LGPVFITKEKIIMFDRVMLAMDMSERTDELLPAFYSLCPNLETEVFLLHVAENEKEAGPDSGYYKKTYSQLQSYANDLHKAGYDNVQLVWEYNEEILNGILKAVDKNKIDLLFLVSHGKGALESAFMGSTTFDVARSTTIPAIIVKDEKPLENYLARILVPTDFSRKSLVGLNVLRGMREHLGEIIFVHSIERWRGETQLRTRTEAAQNMLQEMVDEMKNFGISARYILKHGPASKAICHLATVEKCTLICTSKTGAGLVKGLIMGSTAQNVTLYSPCSILIMPGYEEDAV
jgi:nucleotide-binding universal stress UspA family protein